MGNQLGGVNQTKIEVKLDREISQAGAAVHGTVHVTLDWDKLEMLKSFDQGAVLSLTLRCAERVYFAKTQNHAPMQKAVWKNLIPNEKRSAHNVLFEGSSDIRFFTLPEISKTGKFEVKFSMPIPEKLPSSMYYFGRNLSTLLVDYTLTASLTGLKTNPQQPLPEGTLIYQKVAPVLVRARDNPSKPGISQNAEGSCKNALGMSAGTCSYTGNLDQDVVLQNKMATVSIKLNNSQCGKSVKNIKLDLHRTIIATGKDEAGNEQTFKDEQVVMHGKFPCNIPSKAKVVDEAQFGITLAIVKDNNTEKGRAVVLYDLETGAPNLFNTHKWDTELIPSTDTPNIKVSYSIEMGVWHEGAFQSVKEVPSVHFPLWIARDPKGQIDNGTEGMISTQMQAELANANQVPDNFYGVMPPQERRYTTSNNQAPIIASEVPEMPQHLENPYATSASQAQAAGQLQQQPQVQPPQAQAYGQQPAPGQEQANAPPMGLAYPTL